ncbi:SPOSA6832_03847 [Sporobolomyces salmonicolor]|uniref:SPOSA6832_03847-mRNA-1:cds n=1 Tax=Sporidiobolus salmonicolor TaxID=5005 RepID=A0A0D6EQH5_SPOSA|nr:SPOSA6832_03847 [Sporobolomyces salmonicolor]
MAQVDFSYLQDALTADAELREKIRDAVREVEQAQRACTGTLSRVHSSTKDQLPALLASLDPLLPPLRAALANLAQLVPPQQFYRYSDSFSRSIQTASYIVVMRVFLESEDVATKEDVARQLGILEEWRDHFFLSTEEYLHSLISLSRLAINRVTMGDYAAPVQYSRFAKELANAFGLLNLKNDSLRKRFDSIKYDVKRLEEDHDGPGPAKRARSNDEESMQT